MVYVFEGLPGSYKTSIINKIIRRNSDYIYVPEILETTSGDNSCFQYYVENDICKSDFLIQQKCSVLLSDRAWHSTVVYRCAQMKQTQISDFKKTYNDIYPFRLFEEYYYLYFYIDVESSVAKSNTHAIKSDWMEHEFTNAASQVYESLYQNLHEVSPHFTGKSKFSACVGTIDETALAIERIIHDGLIITSHIS